MKKLGLLKTTCVIFVLCAATAIAAPAQILTTLYSFCSQTNCADGYFPAAGVVQGSDGNFYGTTELGGTNDGGTVFKITPSGTLTTLYNFCSQQYCTDGGNPFAGLVQASDGNFYGTTWVGGGANGAGTVFKITPDGTLTTLHSFNGTDGGNPFAGLVQATDGNFYGTTADAGANGSGGTVFKITPSGTLTTLYNFCSQQYCTDGGGPAAGLVQASDGNFYGTTGYGGAYDYGTVFKITASGTLTTLHSFDYTDGSYPYAGLVQASDGNFYGTTSHGAAKGGLCGPDCGTVFKITPAGTLTTLHSFNGADGEAPFAALVQASDGNFYGTTTYGGDLSCNPQDGCGTVFKITPGGTLTTLHRFSGGDGANSYAGLLQATDGNFYGTTSAGYGTVFRLVSERPCFSCPLEWRC